MKPASPLLILLPALVLVPVVLWLPALSHQGGWDLIGHFLLAALQPSLDPVVLQSLLRGVGVTAGMALLGWSCSLLLGVLLGIASSRLVWRTLSGTALPAELMRRLLAVPRSIHELIWGLLLLQLVGLQPVVAVLAIAIPYGALVARVVSDLLDGLSERNLEALRCAGSGPAAALLTSIAPPLLPGLISYGGYRLECALRSATLLGVFGLGGLGNELLLTLKVIGQLRQRWGMPSRFGLSRASVGRRGRELLLLLLLLVPTVVGVGSALAVDPAALMHWHSLPPIAPNGWNDALTLPWLALVGHTVLLTLLAAALAVGLAPLLLLVVAPWPWGQQTLKLVWALGRLWPPPLTALLLLFVLKPGVLTAALALGFHNLGILGRLLLESSEAIGEEREQALLCSGCGPRLALLYGRFSGLARSYLAYGAYRSDVILRETVVVGLVAGSGLGSQLQESLSSFAFDQLALLLLAYAVLTLVGEDLSDRIRQKLLQP
jgi:phosphonate transport system permease protein